MTAELVEGEPTTHAEDAAAWRAWLAGHADTERSVWLTIYHAASPTPGVPYREVMEHALCFGWVDGKALKRDAESFYLRFTPRNPRSTWSRVNRERAQRMIDAGLMTARGQATIDLAKETGTWDALAEADDGVVPGDLLAGLDGDPVARANFEAFPPSSRYRILAWILTAKRPETRQRRIARTIELAHDNLRANHPPVRN